MGSILFISTGSGVSLLLNENFEGTGTPTNWFSSGSPDYDYSTVPLNGAQSLRVPAGSYALYPNSEDINQTQLYLKFKIKLSNIPASGFDVIMRCRDATFNNTLGVYILSSGVVELAAGAIFGDTVATMSAGTIYDLWAYIKPGNPSGEASVAFATTGSAQPTSGDNFFGGTGNTVNTGLIIDAVFGDSANTKVTNIDFDDVKASSAGFPS